MTADGPFEFSCGDRILSADTLIADEPCPIEGKRPVSNAERLPTQQQKPDCIDISQHHIVLPLRFARPSSSTYGFCELAEVDSVIGCQRTKVLLNCRTCFQ